MRPGRRSDRAAILVRVSQQHQGKITSDKDWWHAGSWLSACNHHMFVDSEGILLERCWGYRLNLKFNTFSVSSMSRFELPRLLLITRVTSSSASSAALPSRSSLHLFYVVLKIHKTQSLALRAFSLLSLCKVPSVQLDWHRKLKARIKDCSG
jgi:hypothetical protein